MTEARIRVLSDSLINKIAAGEVLERPASAVKELVENSIDAGATRIGIELEAGGRSLLRVVDDGIGMSPANAVLALRRHATSKIRSDEDLFSIRTLGFRGEALPSIAEVSRFELTTGRRGDEAGTRVLVDGGKVQRVEDAPNPGGTDICVRRLFFNTPVRLKFLRTPRTEMTHVTQTVTRLAMAHPHVAFELRADGRRVLDAPRSDDLEGRLATLLGRGVVTSMHGFTAESEEMRAEGMISDISFHRSTNAGIYLFVNGRHVRDRTLIAAVLASFKPYLPRGRYPLACVFLDVPADRVDVNVHPAKAEVRFRDSRRIYRFLSGGLSRRLGELAGLRQPDAEVASIVGARITPLQSSMPLATAPAPTFWGSRAARLMDSAPLRAAVRRSTQPSTPAPLTPRLSPGVEASLRPPQPVAARKDGTENPHFGDLEVLGQYAGAFLLCRGAGDLIVVDQEAGRARILFETLARRLPDTPVVAQRLLVPDLLELEREEVDILVAFEPMLVDLGVEISSFGDGTVSVHALPAGIDPRRAHAVLPELAAALRARPRGHLGEALRLDLAAVLARHCPSGRSERLFPEEIDALFATLDRVDFSVAWPGKPVIARFSRSDVQAWFTRAARHGG